MFLQYVSDRCNTYQDKWSGMERNGTDAYWGILAGGGFRRTMYVCGFECGSCLRVVEWRFVQ